MPDGLSRFERAARALKKVPVLKDFWFDWKIYNPRTEVYAVGAR